MSRGLDLSQVDGFTDDEHRAVVAKELRRRMPTLGAVPASAVELEELTSRRDFGRVIGLGADCPDHMKPANRSSIIQEGRIDNAIRATER